MALAPILNKVAIKLIKQFGRTATLTSTIEGEYNPDTAGADTKVDSTITVFLGTYTTNELKAGLIDAGDVPVYSTTKIDKDDTIVIDSVRYAITMSVQYNVEASVVLYIANARRL